MHATIKNGKLAIFDDGSYICLGIKGFRKQIAQIENSRLELKPSTAKTLAVMRAGVAMWDARKAAA